MLACEGRGARILRGESGFTGTSRPYQEGCSSAVQSPAEKRVESRNTAGERSTLVAGLMLGRDQAWINLQTAALDGEVVKSVAELNPPQLDDLQAAAGTPIDRGMSPKVDHTMSQTFEVTVAFHAVVIQE